MQERSLRPVRSISRTFLAFIAFLFGVLLCIASLQGGAFGAVQPYELPATQVSTQLAIDPKGFEASFEPPNHAFNPEMKNDQEVLVGTYWKDLDRMVASRLAVDRAA